MRLFPFERDDQRLDLGWQPVGIPHGPTAAVTQRFGTVTCSAIPSRGRRHHRYERASSEESHRDFGD
jgi:hypothetical protein